MKSPKLSGAVLFSTIDDKYAKKVVKEFMDYADKEGILPAGSSPVNTGTDLLIHIHLCRKLSMCSIISGEVSLHSSEPVEVLRLLSLVIYAIKGLNEPYISLADFDLSNQEIRQELLKHIGAEYNSVLAADITDAHAGAKLVDAQIGNAYQGFQLGRRTATTIFMYSFSGGAERGTTVGEIKRSATTMDNPSSVIVVAVDLLKGKLFYLQNIGDKYYFKNQPNINRIILSKIDNIKEPEIIEAEKENLKSSLKGGKFRITLWPENSAEIPDNEELKLIILHKEDKKIIDDITKNKGGTPRVYRNTLFFLCPLESERPIYLQNLSRSIAYAQIEDDKELGISEEQRREISKEHKKFQGTIKECVQRLYRMVWIPGKEPVRSWHSHIWREPWIGY